MMNITPEQYIRNKYDELKENRNLNDLPEIKEDLELIASRIGTNKAVYTVLITLSLYKKFNPTQDIRLHRIEFEGGFSGRSFDTIHVTPTLMQLGLPSMKESGWLTRSLEQAAPYDNNYPGKITPEALKLSFLKVVDFINQNSTNADNVFLNLLRSAIQYQENNRVIISRIENNELQIHEVIDILRLHFLERYNDHGASKLPVIAIHCLYKLMVLQLERFENCELLPLGSHTASDRTSNSAGDIEVKRGNAIYEAVEVKLDRPPSLHMINVAYEKINRFAVERYYILSGEEMISEEESSIMNLIEEIRNNHGCEVIINGLFPSIKYYLRMIDSVNEFMNIYIENVEIDTELTPEHKLKLREILISKNLIEEL